MNVSPHDVVDLAALVEWSRFSDWQDRRSWYELRDEDTVEHASRDLAEQAAQSCAHELGIPSPPIRWFEMARCPRDLSAWPEGLFSRSERILGLARRDRGEIWLNVRQGSDELVRTVAHEVRHLWQPPPYDLERDELDAETYAAAASRLVAQGLVA